MISKRSALLASLLVLQQAPSCFGFRSGSLNIEKPPPSVPARPRRPMRATGAPPKGQDWIKKSVHYYNQVMRNEVTLSTASKDEQTRLAKHLYHAKWQIRSGHLSRAERIYRKTIRDIESCNEDDCIDAELATTTLLLALVLQRMEKYSEARMVFHRFFRQAIAHSEREPDHECACTAKVLGAYALFEMRFGSVHRSIELARRAAHFDDGLSKLFDWKEFRDARQRMNPGPGKGSIHEVTPCSFVTEVNLPAEDAGSGEFRIRAYRVSDDALDGHSMIAGREPSIIYHTAKPPIGINGKGMNDVPIHIHKSSLNCEIFGSESCKSKDDLEQSMEHVRRHGGAIVYFPPEAQSTSIASGVAASVFRKRGYDTRDAGPRDGCNPIPSILREMRIESIRLMSGTPSMVRRLRELGVNVRGTVPLALDG